MERSYYKSLFIIKRTSIVFFVFFILSSSILKAAERLDFDSDLRTVSFLGYMRATHPYLYDDFIIRYDALEYFKEGQEVIESLGVFPQKIDGKKISIFKLDEVKESYFLANKKGLEGHLKSATTSFDKNITLRDAINILQEPSIGNALNTIIAKFVPSGRDILSTPNLQKKIELIRANLLEGEIINGARGTLIGLKNDIVTREELIHVLKQELEKKQKQHTISLLLLLLDRKIMEEFLDNSLHDLLEIIGNGDLVFDPEFMVTVKKVRQLQELNLIKNTTKKVVDAELKRGLDWIKKYYSSEKILDLESSQPSIHLVQSHPYEAWLRGGVGDCSTCNSFAVSLAQNEEIFWIKNESGLTKGYLQISRVWDEDDQPSLFVSTISGAGVSSSEVRVILEFLLSYREQFGVNNIYLPPPTRYFDLINYTEVSNVFLEYTQNRPVETFQFRDKVMREKISAFSEDSLDDPNVSDKGIQIQSRNSNSEEKIVASIKKNTIQPGQVFPQQTLPEIIITAIDLLGRKENQEFVFNFVKSQGVDLNRFKDLVGAVENISRLNIHDFHQNILKHFHQIGVKIDLQTIRTLPVLFKGHMNAPDSLEEQNLNLALQYIRRFLLAFSDIPAVYEVMGKYSKTLSQSSEFQQIVLKLFSKFAKETGRVLDFWELEHKSAYRTLINIFTSGFNPALYQDRFLEIENGVSYQPTELGQMTYVLKLTLLSQIYKYDSKYHDQLITQIEKWNSEGITLGVDTSRALANYFSSYLVSINDKGIASEINEMLMSGPTGVSIASVIGLYESSLLDVPRIFEFLMAIDQPLAAAYLIHKDPWPNHELASHWISLLWSKKDSIGVARILEAVIKTPQWINVKGFQKILPHVLKESLKNSSDQKLAVKVLFLKDPKQLNKPEIKWLSAVTSSTALKLVKRKAKKHVHQNSSLVNLMEQNDLQNCASSLIRKGS